MGFVAELAEGVFKLTVDGKGLATGLGEAEEKNKASMERMARTMGNVRNVAAIVFAAGAESIHVMGDAAKEEETNLASFKNTFALLGPEFQAQIPQSEQWAENLERVAAFEADDLLDQLGKTAQVTGSVTDGTLAMNDAVDLARLKHIDLESAVNLVDMAYNGQTKGLKKLVGALGDGVKGHEALVAVQKKVAHGAESMANTIEVAEDRNRIAWHETEEKLGKDMMPTLIKLYGSLAKVADMLQGVNGNVILVGTGIAGLTALIAQGTKWLYEFRAAQIAVNAAQAAGNAEGVESISWLSKMPGMLNPVTLAVLALAAAWVKAYSDADKYFKRTGGNAGTDGTGAPYIMTERGLQTVKEISDESAMSRSDYAFAYLGGVMDLFNPFNNNTPQDSFEGFRRIQAAGRAEEDTNLTIQRMKEMARDRKNERTQRDMANYPDQASTVKQQLAGLI